TAFFERERSAVPSMISGAGLRSDVWCRVAPGIGGDEVALAVFERGGSVITWLDTWTARRELVETSPQRYWGRRLAQRPLDEFLAQLLQFQCQLVDGLADPGGGGDGPDPCEERRAALVEVDQVLGALGDQVVLERLVELRERVTAVLAGTAPTTTGSILL